MSRALRTQYSTLAATELTGGHGYAATTPRGGRHVPEAVVVAGSRRLPVVTSVQRHARQLVRQAFGLGVV